MKTFTKQYSRSFFRKMAGLQVLAYEMMKNLTSEQKVKRILAIVKNKDIVMLEGKLTPDEETDLIAKAMANVSGSFSGIEVAFLSSTRSKSIVEKLRNSILRIIAKDRFGITVIGPSKIIKEIKMDPNKLEILFK